MSTKDGLHAASLSLATCRETLSRCAHMLSAATLDMDRIDAQQYGAVVKYEAMEKELAEVKRSVHVANNSKRWVGRTLLGLIEKILRGEELSDDETEVISEIAWECQ